MSRVGKKPIPIPQGVKLNIGDALMVEGPKGKLDWTLPSRTKAAVENNSVVISRQGDDAEAKALHGLSRALINNMIVGVSQGFKVEQELVGVGYKAEVKGQMLDLTLGYSHNIILELPKEIKAEAITEKGKNPKIVMNCIDNQLLGQVAAKIRSLRKPEPYKGKGIKFMDEVLRRKAGKSASKAK